MTGSRPASGAGRVLAAIDSSDAALQALAWAMRESKLRGAELQVLHVWLLTSGSMSGLPESVDDALERVANLVVDKAVDQALAVVGADADGVVIHRQVKFGQPIPVIIAAANEVDLLVVGSHRHSQLGGLLLGSVSQFLSVHAPCPVVVVHADGGAEPGHRVEPVADGAAADAGQEADWTPGTLEELSEAESRLLLGSKDLGRIAVVREGRPEIFPVNFVLDGDVVIFRTGPGTKLDWSVMGPVAFEVEDIDSETRGGWVVEVKGTARDLTSAVDSRSEREKALPLTPWVGGEHSNWVSIVRPEISGRRLIPAGQVPVE